MKPGSITTLFLAEIIYIQEFLWDSVKKVIYRALVQSSCTKMDCDRCIDFLGGEDVTPIIKSSHDGDDSQWNQCQFLVCPTL